MGNNISVQEGTEDQENEFSSDDSEYTSEPGTLQNGPVAIQNVQTVSLQRNDVVDSRANIKQNNVAPSSEKTMEISSISKENGMSPGSEAKSSMPVAKSRFSMTLSRPVSGRTRESAGDSAAGPVKIDANIAKLPVNNTPSESPKSPETAVVKEGSDKGPNSALLNASQANVGEAPEPEDTASKPREISLFDKLFKPERARENAKAQPNLSQETNTAQKQAASITVKDVSGLQQDSTTQEQNIDAGSQSAVQLQSSNTFSSPSEEDLNEPRGKEENSKAVTSSENNPVMSFFKTLVTPKSASKSEDEPKSESEDKSAKEKQETTETRSVEKPVVSVTVKSEKGAPSQAIKQEIKITERAVKEQVPAPSEAQTDGPQKPSKDSTPRAKLFWKKPIKEVPPPSTPEENTAPEPETQDVVVQIPVQATTKDVTKTQEGQKAKKPNLMTFFKQLSGSGDGGYTNTEEVDGKDPDQPTLDPTEGSATKMPEKPVAPSAAASQPAIQKGKESTKEKKATDEPSKQKAKQETKDSREIPSGAQEPLSEPQATENGGDATREPALRRTEKKQPFGSFFKGIGPKRTSDAEVQTDPVSILPAEKLK